MPKGKRRKKEQEVPKLDSLKQLNFNAAGLDIGVSEIWVCVPEGRDEVSVRCFDTFTVDLENLADWLGQCSVDTVAMESTGVYWIPIYEILESRGFEVYLVNAQFIKNVPGKETDVLACQWIQQLHTYGLLRASFRPDEEICELRAYLRHRDNLIRYRSSHIQHMQKALHLMNIQLTNVISDITGRTGMEIMRAIVAGNRDPVELARYRDPRCHSSEEDIAKSLKGNYKPEHLFVLQQALLSYDFYTEQIKNCDVEIQRKYSEFEPQVDLETLSLSKKKQQLRNQLYQLCGVDLTQVDGLDAILVQTIISEIGLNMSKWPTARHFCSWLTLAPHNHITGGKVIKSKTKKTKNRATLAFRMAAQSAGRSNSALGAFYRRVKSKHDAPKAITATAHKIARIVYHLLKYREEYVDPGQDYYEQKYQAQRLKKLQRQAKKLGMKLVPEVA